MAAPDPVLVNLAGCTFTLLSAETGVIIQDEDRSVECSMKDVYNAVLGCDIGFVAYNWKAMQNFSAIVNGSSGFAVATPGVVLSVANTLGIGAALNGVASGGIYTRTVNISHRAEDLRNISISTIQRYGIS